ncbi:MAG: BamA/TamA family outer membrane protein [Candidatus Eiseniibacteriota bacterium]
MVVAPFFALLLAASATAPAHPLAAVPKDRSTGERALRVPVAIAELPFALLGDGLEHTMSFVEHRNLIGKASRIPPWLAERHLIVTGGSEGEGAGFGLGVGAFAGIGQGQIAGITQWTVREYQTHSLLLQQALGERTALHAWGRYRVRARDNFSGVGQGTSPDDRTQYRQDDVGGGAGITFRPASVQIAVDGAWSDFRELEAPSGGEHPDTIEEFPDLPGIGGAKLVAGSVALSFPAVPYRGGPAPESAVVAGVQVARDADGSAFGFSRFTLSLYQAVPVFWGDRVLAARVRGSITQPHAGREIPFWLLEELGGSSGLRAYDPLRFRDRDSALLNVEYRFPIWDIGLPSGTAMDAVFFFDAGLVSPAIQDDLVMDDFKSDVGFGLRVRNRWATLLRIDAAFAADETRIEYRTGRDF